MPTQKGKPGEAWNFDLHMVAGPCPFRWVHLNQSMYTWCSHSRLGFSCRPRLITKGYLYIFKIVWNNYMYLLNHLLSREDQIHPGKLAFVLELFIFSRALFGKVLRNGRKLMKYLECFRRLFRNEKNELISVRAFRTAFGNRYTSYLLVTQKWKICVIGKSIINGPSKP